MDVLPDSEVFGQSASDNDSNAECLMLIAALTPAMPGKQGSQLAGTIRLPGTVGKHQILILVDSGSASSLISETLATTMHCNTGSMQPVIFTVASGAPIQCT